MLFFLRGLFIQVVYIEHLLNVNGVKGMYKIVVPFKVFVRVVEPVQIKLIQVGIGDQFIEEVALAVGRRYDNNGNVFIIYL